MYPGREPGRREGWVTILGTPPLRGAAADGPLGTEIVPRLDGEPADGRGGCETVPGVAPMTPPLPRGLWAVAMVPTPAERAAAIASVRERCIIGAPWPAGGAHAPRSQTLPPYMQPSSTDSGQV